MKKIFDTSIDVRIRQFYILALAGCIGNLSGFIGNALIYGFTAPTFFCGICALVVIVSSLAGILGRHTKICTYVILILLTFIEFPTLYYIYRSGTIVYMVLSLVSIAAFMPAVSALVMSFLAIICDAAVIIVSFSNTSGPGTKMTQESLSTTLCSTVIVLISAFLITFLLKMQQHAQEEQLKAANEKIQSVADHDGLTGIYNRGYLNKHLDEIIESGKQDFYVVLIDLDYFKKVNDMYGHLFGDKVLIELCRIFERYTKDNGFCARFGGEEFMLIFDGISQEEVIKRVSDIRKDYKAFLRRQKNAEFSFSSGIVKYEAGMDVTALFRIADEKMYSAKNNNRNRDVV